MHSKPVPYLGGLGVYGSFITALTLVYPFENRLLWLIVGTTILLFGGLFDDLVVLRPLHKFGAQLLAVLCFLKGGYALKNDFFSVLINIPLSGFWMLSIINAFNLIDVMDGLATVVAIVASTTFLTISLLTGMYKLSLLLVAFICPLIVFFWYNKPPARMYLGDAGALYIGGFLSALPLLFSWREYSELGFLVPLVILGIPLFEGASLILIRTMKGIPFYQGSPHHFSLYLKAKGWSIPLILAFTASMGILLSTVSILFLFGTISLPAFAAALTIIAIFVITRIFL